MKKFEVNRNITTAHTIDTDFYTSADVYAACKESVFAKSWQYVGGTHLLQSDNLFPFVLLEHYLDEPLLLLKNANGDISCCSNVCTHRGNILATEPCKTSQLRCKYHGRVFDLEGRFKYMPEFEQAKNFPTAADNLAQIPLFQIGSLLFANISQKADIDAFTPMLERISWMPLDEMCYRADLSTAYDVPAHWALYVENYLEGFHIPFVHNGLNAVVDYGTYATELYASSNLQLALGKKTDHCFEIPEGHVDEGKSVVAYYYWVYPNMMFNFYPWGLSFNYVEPKGLDRCIVKFEVYVWDEAKLEQGAGSGLNQVELEDEAIVAQVQKGIRSRFYSRGRFSPTREQGPHHFHQLLAESLR